MAAALVGINLVETLRPGKARIDYRGAALLAATVSLLLLALGQTGTNDAVLTTWQVAGLYVGSLALGAWFVRVESSSEEPVVPFDLLRNPLVATTIITGFLLGVAMFGALSFVPLFVQAALGGTASDAGRALIPLLLGWVGMSIVTGRVLPRVGFRPMILGGLMLVCLGFFGLLGVDRATGGSGLSIDLGLMGMGMGMTMLSLLLALQQAVSTSRLGVATSVGQFSRSVGGAVGRRHDGRHPVGFAPTRGDTGSASHGVCPAAGLHGRRRSRSARARGGLLGPRRCTPPVRDSRVGTSPADGGASRVGTGPAGTLAPIRGPSPLFEGWTENRACDRFVADPKGSLVQVPADVDVQIPIRPSL